MITTALFDIDGVLNAGVTADYSKIGIKKSDMQPFWNTFLAKCLTGALDTKKLAESCFKSWNYTGTVQEFFTFWHESEKEVYSNVIEEIKQLKQRGIQVVTATNQDKYRFEYMKTTMGFATIFDELHASCNLGFAKPNPEYYKLLLSKLGVPAEQCVYWDDHVHNIEVAKSLGITAHLVTNKDELIEQMKKY